MSRDEDAPVPDTEAITLSKLRPYINSHQPIPIDLMVKAFNRAARSREDSQYRAAAEDFMPEAGTYLHPIELSWFISGRGTDDEARQSIRHRKAYITRATDLMPTLLSLLQVKDGDNLESILRCVDDFCRDLPLIEAMPHEKRVRKEIVTGIKRVTRAIADLAELLDEFGHHIDNEFNDHTAAIARASKNNWISSSFEPFRNDLRRLALAAEIVLYRERAGNGGLIVTDNKTKTNTVECMYQLSLWQDAPPFVTTPGSDFATACSLLYEIASGECDVSFAGAINKFARSAARTEIYEEEQSFRRDNSDDGMRARGR